MQGIILYNEIRERKLQEHKKTFLCNNKITSIVKIGTPENTPPGNVGDIMIDTANNYLYVCGSNGWVKVSEINNRSDTNGISEIRYSTV